jgi:repressor LexA
VDSENQKPDLDFMEVPVMGAVTEGAPIEITKMIRYMRLPIELCREKRVYMLEIKGNFFTSELIGNGDYVVVESVSKFDDNQIVLISIDKKNVTLRRISREKNKLTLHPPSPEIKEKTVDESEIRILGVVIGVIRNYLE